MNANFTNTTDSPISVDRAEEQVRDSIANFEAAMDHLRGKVEGTAQSVSHIVQVARKPKEKWLEFNAKARELNSRIQHEYQRNPEPFHVGAALFAGAILGLLVGRLTVQRTSPPAAVELKGDKLEDFIHECS